VGPAAPATRPRRIAPPVRETGYGDPTRLRERGPVGHGEQKARLAGQVPQQLALPTGVVGTQRAVWISEERLRHLAARRPERLHLLLTSMAAALADPQYLGYRPDRDPRRVEFVRDTGAGGVLLLVAVKFLDDRPEAWVSTAHPLKQRYLTRRLRAGTMRPVGRGP
jgi:hypothetical protein